MGSALEGFWCFVGFGLVGLLSCFLWVFVRYFLCILSVYLGLPYAFLIKFLLLTSLIKIVRHPKVHREYTKDLLTRKRKASKEMYILLLKTHRARGGAKRM